MGKNQEHCVNHDFENIVEISDLYDLTQKLDSKRILKMHCVVCYMDQSCYVGHWK